MKLYDNIDMETARERAKEKGDDELLAEIEEYDSKPKTAWLHQLHLYGQPRAVSSSQMR